MPPYSSLDAHPSYRQGSRWVLTPEDTDLLESVFQATPFPSRQVHQELSGRLQVRPRQVQSWFQNKRQRVKNDTTSTPSSLVLAESILPPDDALPPSERKEGGAPSVSAAVSAAAAAAAAAMAAAEIAEAVTASAMAEVEAARSKAQG